MKILIACEFSGTVRDAFIAKGHEAMSCDLLDTEKPGPHYKGDVLDVLNNGTEWDMMICHPPCTYLSGSGFHWIKRGRIEHDGRPRIEHYIEALAFAKLLLAQPIPKIALENPIGKLSTEIRKPEQIIQPYKFGADASKSTCLWLNGLPLLRPTLRVKGRMVECNGRMVERWANQTDSGQNALGPSADRWAARSITYPGVAAAMAEQWG